MRRFISVLSAIAFSLIVAGCASSGREINTTNASKIQKGVSTKADVKRLVGEPQQISNDSDGNQTWSYTYTRATAKGTSFIPIAGAFMGGVNTQNQSLIVKFNPEGTVTFVESSYGGMSVDTGATAGGEAKTPGVAK